VRASRVSWELTYGAIPPGAWVLHHCDERLCTRPDHLFLGTVADNNADMVQKGRLADQAGQHNGRAKLTRDKATAIRARYQAGELPAMLAAEFGVTRTTIRKIGTGRLWT